MTSINDDAGTSVRLDVWYDVAPHQVTSHTAAVMSHFGVSRECGPHVIAQRLELSLRAGDVVLWTGASGSGKSSLLRATAAQCEGVVWLDQLLLPEGALVDAIEWPFADALALLTSCGLGEPRLMLRTAAELSEGERYRFRLALAIACRPRWIVADEFSATLDRTLAKIIAANVRKLADRFRMGFLLATTHEDVAEDLAPDCRIVCRSGEEPEVQWVERGAVPKKEGSALPVACRSPAGARRTGRTSRDGITAVTFSDWCARSRCCGTTTCPSASASSSRPR